MIPPLLWILAGSVVILIGYWLFVIAEGAYFGPRAVRYIYDRGASTYDDVKDYDRLEEFQFLGKPLFDALEASSGAHALVLDVATGSGRLPIVLMDIPFFKGQVVGLDSSRGMLLEASAKTDYLEARLHLVEHMAAPLPFADDALDAVTMLEALEFLPDRTAALDEAVRVLAPGGWLLITNRIGLEAQLMPGRVDSPEGFEARLARHGLTDTRTQRWQSYYDLVWARKPGDPVRRDHVTPWRDILRCPSCGQAGAWLASGDELVCQACPAVFARRDRVWSLRA